jgi:hypothetical protein
MKHKHWCGVNSSKPCDCMRHPITPEKVHQHSNVRPPHGNRFCWNAERARDRQRLWKYNLTKEQLQAYKAITNCQIYGESISGKNHHIDHCHETNVVRGVLCHRCNTGIGHLRHGVNRLIRAIGYLNIDREAVKEHSYNPDAKGLARDARTDTEKN